MLSDLLSIKFIHKENERFLKTFLTTLAFSVTFINSLRPSDAYTRP